MRSMFLEELSKTNEKTKNAGHFIPECDKDGSFKRIQCWKMIGVCWCVGPHDGKELPGSRANITAGEKLDCFKSMATSSIIMLIYLSGIRDRINH